jgi:hypothetical protein
MVVTLWQEMEGKPKRTYTANLERDREHLSLLGLTHAPPLQDEPLPDEAEAHRKSPVKLFLTSFHS